jgi:hypothetical protein
MTIGRPPETIEQWILAGKVDAEPVGPGWLVDMRSLLNAATAEDAARSGNGGSADHGAGSPVQPADDPGGHRAPSHEATAPVAIAEPVAEAPPATAEGVDAAVGPSREPPEAASTPADAETRLAPAADAERPPRPPREPTVEIASAAIAALSDRLEQAMSEIDRLQDERLKLALQLGYAQAQLKASGEQLRALTAPPEPDPFTRLVRWLFRRGSPGANGTY